MHKGKPNPVPYTNVANIQFAAGRRDVNPSVWEVLSAADILRLQGFMALDPVWGNSSRNRRLFQSKNIDVTDAPLPRAKRSK